VKKLVAIYIFSSLNLFSNSFGVEVNLIRYLFTLPESGIDTFSGGFNYFNDDYKFEIAIPITYNKVNYTFAYGRYNDYPDTSLTTNIHYRKFLFSQKADGLYIGILSRYTHIKGKLKNSFQIASIDRFGMGGEIGFRIRKKESPLYFGASFSYGRHFDNYGGIFKHDNFIINMDGKKNFWDIEFFKFGYEF